MKDHDDAVMRTSYWTRHLFHEDESAEDLRKLDTKMPIGDEAFRRELMSTMFNGMKLPLEEIPPETMFQEEFWKKYGTSADFTSLLELTAGDPALSAAGATRIAKAVAKAMEESSPPPEDGDGQPAPTNPWMREQLTQDGHKRALANMVSEIRKTRDEIQEAKDVVQALSWGNEAGQLDPADISRALELGRRFNLKKFIALVGQLRGMMRNAIAQRVDATSLRMNGIDTGRDISMLVPSQLELPLEIFIQRYAASQLLVYDFDSPPGEKEWPFVVMVDKSGSMGLGNRWETAQGIAASIGFLAAATERECYAMLFDHVVQLVRKVDGVKAILDLIAFEPSGGTSFDTAILGAIEIADKAGSPGWDLVIVCDDECSVSHKTELALLNSGARLHALFVDTPLGGSLLPLCSMAAQLNTVSMGGLHVPLFRVIKEML